MRQGLRSGQVDGSGYLLDRLQHDIWSSRLQPLVEDKNRGRNPKRARRAEISTNPSARFRVRPQPEGRELSVWIPGTAKMRREAHAAQAHGDANLSHLLSQGSLSLQERVEKGVLVRFSVGRNHCPLLMKQGRESDEGRLGVGRRVCVLGWVHLDWVEID